MKMTLSFSQFCDNWPESRKEQFSHEALRAIFEYIEEYEASAETETEFDPIAICCEWNEAASALEAVENYNYEPEGDNDEEKEGNAREWLENQTTVLDAGEGIVYLRF